MTARRRKSRLVDENEAQRGYLRPNNLLRLEKPREDYRYSDLYPTLDPQASLTVFDKPVTPESDDVKTESGTQTPEVLLQPPAPLNGVEPPGTPRKRGRPRKYKKVLTAAEAESKISTVPVLPKKKYGFRTIEPYAPPQHEYIDRVMMTVGYHDLDGFEMPRSYIKTFVSENDPALSSVELVAAADHQKQKRIKHEEEEEDEEEEEEEKEKDKKDKSGKVATSISRPVTVEYDMDEQDNKFLEDLNRRRVEEDSVPKISREIFEFTMTLLESQWFLLEQLMPPKKKVAITDEITESSIAEQKCSVCDDAECDNSNAIVFCDSCDIAVHQECYGVPFIPEGQWLCAQCTISRRRKANCVFCPNKLGAMKRTDTNHWAHVVCALWIPETTMKNKIYMEPITGLRRIPRGRWKLICYICKYRIGACIQCVNKSCVQAYHPTCALKAGLFMKMNSGAVGALYDPKSLETYCDKHTPAEYAESVDVKASLKRAQDHYAANKDEHRYTGNEWEEALEQSVQNTNTETKFVRKRTPGVPAWRTPQGTPAPPEVFIDKVSHALHRFSIIKLRDFLHEMARYWTLKRQMRRGAALSKRLQVALDVSQSQDPINNLNLAQAENLLPLLARLREQVGLVRDREELKLEMAETTEEMVQLAYFPVSRIINPIWDRLTGMNNHRLLFEVAPTGEGVLDLNAIEEKVENYRYKSVKDFTDDLEGFIADAYAQLHGDMKHLLSRIIRAVVPMVKEAKERFGYVKWSPLKGFKLNGLDIEPSGSKRSNGSIRKRSYDSVSLEIQQDRRKRLRSAKNS
ncbi:nuA3 HAT complex component Nto1p [Trichomonascus vanleenenianus]|uniref:nuA3 HAT complex component Nto1p n=1 Tax=Trichomonascus vanleenenianus TaxID=2268995 RepID=UPI003ECB0FF9